MSDEELREWRDVWLSRVMFNEFVGWPRETRTFDEYLQAVLAREAVSTHSERTA